MNVNVCVFFNSNIATFYRKVQLCFTPNIESANAETQPCWQPSVLNIASLVKKGLVRRFSPLGNCLSVHDPKSTMTLVSISFILFLFCVYVVELADIDGHVCVQIFLSWHEFHVTRCTGIKRMNRNARSQQLMCIGHINNNYNLHSD